MTTIYSNNVAAVLAAGIGPSDTAVLVTSGQGARFPDPAGVDHFWATLIHVSTGAIEIVKCTDRASDTLTVVRGQDGTTPISFTTGSAVEMRLVADMMREVDYRLVRSAINGLAALGPDGFVPDAQIAPSFTRDTELTAGLAGKQNTLGFTPVQQGTGTNQSSNTVKIGWGNGPYAGKLAATVDTTDLGMIAMESWVASYIVGRYNVPGGIAGLDSGTLLSPSVIPALPYLSIVSGGAVGGTISVTGNVTATGGMVASGNVTGATLVSNQNFVSQTAAAVLAPGSAGICYLRPSGAGSAVGELQVNTSGVATCVNFTATSDMRLKQDILPRDVRLHLADSLDWKSFVWKESGMADIGVIAQQVLQFAPEHVYARDDGMLTVDKASLALELALGLASRLRTLEADFHA